MTEEENIGGVSPEAEDVTGEPEAEEADALPEAEEPEEPEAPEAAKAAPVKKPGFAGGVAGTAIILCAVTVITVFLLSLVNYLTDPLIKQKLSDDKSEAVSLLFGNGARAERLEGFEDVFREFEAQVLEVSLIFDELRLGDEKRAGYCVMAAPKGFAGSVVMLVAVGMDMRVIDALILDMNETAGYGTKMVSEDWFIPQFAGKTRGITGIRSEASGGGNSIQIIAGVTKSSRAFLNGINAALGVAEYIDGALRESGADKNG